MGLTYDDERRMGSSHWRCDKCNRLVLLTYPCDNCSPHRIDGAEWYFTTTGTQWASANGKIDLGQMSDQHISNVLALLRKRGEGLEVIYNGASPDAYMTKAILEECKRRGDLRRLFTIVMTDRAVPFKQASDGILPEFMEVARQMRIGGRLPRIDEAG